MTGTGHGRKATGKGKQCDGHCYIFRLLWCQPYTDYHWDCIISLSRSLHKALTLILVPIHRDLCYHCTIWSDLSLSVRYNLLQVQLSLVDAYRPLLSFTYTSIYNKEYINCTTRTLRPWVWVLVTILLSDANLKTCISHLTSQSHPL